MKKKFVLEFDEEPTFLYVSQGGGKREKIYLHGQKVNNWRSLKLTTDMENPVEYDISYVDAPKPKAE
jgi:hypothetical protein